MAAFIQVEEVQSNLVVTWALVEKGARDFFREGWVGDRYITMSTVGLEGGLVLMDRAGVLEEEGGTLGEAVEIIYGVPVEEGEDLITLEQISKINVVIKRLAMVR